jgi:hypothetical protein
MALVDLFTSATLTEIKAKVAGFAETAQLFPTSWYPGAPGEQLYQAFTQALQFYVGGNAQIVRGFFLDLATDPGDEDPYDPTNVTLEPAPGFLSALGLNCFFTVRPGATFATTDVVMTNNTSFPTDPFLPGAITVARAGHPEVTYRNSADPSLYLGAGGTTYIPAGQSRTLPFTAETPGTGFNVVPDELTECPTLPSLGVTNPGAAIGTDRMSAPDYRALCRTQAAATSPNGAPDAWRRGATTNLDGTPLLRPDGAPVGITKVQVSAGSPTGRVDVYYGDDDGTMDATDVATANANIISVVTSVPDGFVFGPSFAPGLVGGVAATPISIVPTWAVKFRSKYRGATVSSGTVNTAIKAALAERFKEYPIGGFEQTAGAGSISLEEIRATVKSAHPAITDAVMSSPVGATAIGVGEIPRLLTPTGTETAVSP